MHSSRIRTVCSISRLPGTWSRGGVPGPGVCTWSGGVPSLGVVYLVPRGYLVRWVYLVPGGCTWFEGGVPGPRGPPGLGGVPGPGGCTWVYRCSVNGYASKPKQIEHTICDIFYRDILCNLDILEKEIFK